MLLPPEGLSSKSSPKNYNISIINLEREMSICISAAKSRRSKHAWMFHKEATPTFASKNEFKQTPP